MERKFWKKLIAVLLAAAVLCTTFIMRLSVFGQDGEQISEAYSDYDIFTEGTRDQGERTEIEQEALNAAAEGSIEAEAVIDSETENGVSGSAETIQPGDGTVSEGEAPWEPGDGTVPEGEAPWEPGDGTVPEEEAPEQAGDGMVSGGEVPEQPENGTDEVIVEGEAAEEETIEFGSGGRSCFYTDDSVEVEVILSAESEVPEDAQLFVRAISDADADYERLACQAEEAVDGQAEQMLFYDISFYTAEQEYIPVWDAATVSIRFKDRIVPAAEGGITVLHYEEETEEPVALAAVEVERDAEEALAALTFQTEGFSIYAVVTVNLDMSQVVELTDLNGKSYAILSHTGKYAMLPKSAASGEGKLDYTQDKTNLASTGMWTFTKSGNGDNTYIISSGGKYLNMSSGRALTLVMEENRASVFIVSLYENQYVLILSNGNYINSYGGESNMSGFAGWSGNDAGSQLLLYEAPPEYVMDLDGKKYAIVNRTTGVGMTGVATEAEENQAGLSASPVTFIGDNYVSGEGLAEWLFEEASEEGSYYISTIIDGKTQYLNMKLNTDNQGSLTLSNDRQKIWVRTAGNGKVLLSIALDGKGYINSSGSVDDHRFWVYDGDGENSQQNLCELKIEENAFLRYDLGTDGSTVGGHAVAGDSWITEPFIESEFQGITENGVPLYYVSGAGDDGYYLRKYTSGYIADIAAALDNAGKSCGKQFRFDGWEAEVDGATFLFAEGADAWPSDGGIHIEDVEGTERVLPLGTTLKGRWTEFSDLVTFYVNYTGTILDTEGDVSGRNQKDFTGVIGIGHVYYGSQQVGTDGIFGNDANEQIRIKFTKEFDEDDPACQIVMDYVTSYENGEANLYRSAEGINDTELERYLLNYIRTSGITIQVSTADNKNNPAIDNENATVDNYSVRWYVLKEQTDGWHIDGVMVAKTAEITVAKTFSGLSDDQVKSILGSGGENDFDIAVDLGTGSDGTPQSYITMVADRDAGEGQYSYYGQEQAGDGNGGQSYIWVLNAITDEQYALTEEKYTLDGYDVSTIAVHYYKGEDGSTQIAYNYADTTNSMSESVVGGKTTAVTFNNFYTKKETGALSIIKRSEGTGENDPGGVLQGAEFTLYQSDGTTVAATSVSNSRGAVYFANLEPGTYILEETKAPEGYVESIITWTVEVVKHSDSTIMVTVYENDKDGKKNEDTDVVCYEGGVKKSYTIENTPEARTLRMTKTFEDLTAVQMESIVQKSGEGTEGGYYIRISDEQDETSSTDLYLHDAMRSQDGYSFTWMLKDLAMTDIEGNEKDYKISEHNYLTADYADTVVTAVVNGEKKAVNIEREGDSADAYVEGIRFDPNKSDTVELTNRYINQFTLSLQKKDSQTGEPLAGAEFDVYGSYRESANTAKYIEYTDPETGAKKYVYYIATITSDENGLATQNGLNLSGDEKTFVYVLHEDHAPDGYMADGEPVVIQVDSSSPDYKDGIYSVAVNNTKYSGVTVEKQVKGNLGDHEKMFRFSAEVIDSAGKRVTSLEAADGAGYSVNEDGIISFSLKSGESVKLQLPKGYQLKLSENEEDREGYRCTLFLNGTEYKSDSFTISDGMEITVENYKDANVDTGVRIPGTLYKAALLFAAGILAFLLGKRRRPDEG